MCPFDSIACLGVEKDNVAFGQFCNVLLMSSGVMSSIRSLKSAFVALYSMTL